MYSYRDNELLDDQKHCYTTSYCNGLNDDTENATLMQASRILVLLLCPRVKLDRPIGIAAEGLEEQITLLAMFCNLACCIACSVPTHILTWSRHVLPENCTIDHEQIPNFHQYSSRLMRSVLSRFSVLHVRCRMSPTPRGQHDKTHCHFYFRTSRDCVQHLFLLR